MAQAIIWKKNGDRSLPFSHIAVGLLLCFLLPIIIMFNTSTISSVNTSNQLIAQSNQRMAQQLAERADIVLNTIEANISNEVFSSSMFRQFGNHASQLDNYIAFMEVVDYMDIAIATFDSLDAMCFYSSADSLWAARFSQRVTGASYAHRNAIRTAVRSYMEGCSPLISTGWFVLEIDDVNYLATVVGERGAFMCALVTLEDMVQSAETPVSVIFADSATGEALTQSSFVQKNLLNVSGAGSGYRLSGAREKYMVVSSPMSRAGLNVVLAISAVGYTSKFTSMQLMLMFVSLLSIAFLPMFNSVMRKCVGVPLTKLSEAMERVRKGDINVRMQEVFITRELNTMADVFNDMVSQIRDLRIEAYEREIARKQVELQYLQLQIRPHFMLNCLKSVYASAQQNKNDQVQAQIIAISKITRYMFRNMSSTVTLAEEMEYVTNYVELQRIGHMFPPRLSCDGDEALLVRQLPPLSVGTFVENAVKHRRDAEKPLNIRIHYARISCEDGDYLNVVTRDNGGGFPDDVLAEINKPVSSEVRREHHIGQDNIRHRMKLIYGERAVLTFYNEGTTAVVDMMVPLDGAAERGRMA